MARLIISEQEYSADAFLNEWYQYGKKLYSSSKDSLQFNKAARVIQFVSENRPGSIDVRRDYDACIDQYTSKKAEEERRKQEESMKTADAQRTVAENEEQQRKAEQQTHLKNIESIKKQILDEQSLLQKNRLFFVLEVALMVAHFSVYIIMITICMKTTASETMFLIPQFFFSGGIVALLYFKHDDYKGLFKSGTSSGIYTIVIGLLFAFIYCAFGLVLDIILIVKTAKAFAIKKRLQTSQIENLITQLSDISDKNA